MRLNQMLTRQEQMSETFIVSAFLALSGGFQDAYTYVVRGGVFANAQTGNVVLMSIHFLEREWKYGIRYLFPILAFAIGVFVAERVQHRFKHAQKIHWRQGILLTETLLLLAVGFLPHTANTIATILISFSCALQVQSFRKIDGNAYASTMCIGNLRSGTAAFSSFLRTKAPEDLKRVAYYFGIIAIFAVGAALGGHLSFALGTHAIWVAIIFLTAGILLMSA